MSDSIATRLSDIEARANAATEGPWVASSGELVAPSAPRVIALVPTSGDDQDGADIEFLAAARTDVPWLVKQVRTLLIRDEVLQGAYRTACCYREEAEKRVRELEALAEEAAATLDVVDPYGVTAEKMRDRIAHVLHGKKEGEGDDA